MLLLKRHAKKKKKLEKNKDELVLNLSAANSMFSNKKILFNIKKIL
jgi:hypothetical protein